MTTHPSRRRFLQSLGGAALALPALSPLGALANPPSRKLGVALVGLGYYSRDLLAPALQHTQYCELRGIVTGTPAKIPQWQERYGIADGNVYNYDNMHQLADNPDIDIVYIVVPTGLHKKYAVVAADAGKHVWCEKPMAMNAGECQEIIDRCRKNKVFLSVGYRMQHEPNTRTVMDYAHSLPYGPVTGVKAVGAYAGGGLPADNWRMQKHMGGGAMYDMGVYPLNAARYSTGMEPISISARHEKTHPEIFTEVDETTYFTLEFPGDVTAECMTSVVKPGNRLDVTCEEGWYYLEPMSNYTGVSGKTSSGKALDKSIANQQATQMDNDALAILQGKPAQVPGEEGMRDIVIVEAAFRSAAADGKLIKL